MSATPILKYSFDSWTGGTIILNEGSLGTAGNGTLCTVGIGSSNIINTDCATGTQCLSLNTNMNGTFTNSNGGYMSIPPFTFGGTSYTICCWYKKNATTTAEWWARLWDMGTSGNVNNFVCGFKGIAPYSTLFNSKVDSMGSENAVNMLPGTPNHCCDGIWRHVAVVFDNSILKYNFYLNGVLCNNSLTGTNMVNTSRPYCYIGRSVFPADSYGTLLIDDFRLYSSALSQSDISAICGNNMYHQNTLLPSLFNAYVPLSNSTVLTHYKIGGGMVDLCNVYAPYSSGTHVNTGFCLSDSTDIGYIFNANTYS